ncbi:MAG: glycosyltransferase family 61 protein [Verrucomicrobia bacterium]|nr:glycosyltransferase family 61 protein [Verrucomicrobiota bacterium]
MANLRDLRLHFRRYAAVRATVYAIRALRRSLFLLAVSFCRVVTSPIPGLGFPVGFFSEYENLRASPPKVFGRVEIESQGSPSALPDSLIALSKLKQYECQPWPILWCMRRDALLISESLALIDSGKRLCIEAAYSKRFAKDDPAWTFPIGRKPLDLRGPWTSVISRFTPATSPTNYTHWFTDALPRLAFLNEFPEQTKVLVPASLSHFQAKTLEWMGIFERCRPTSESNIRIEEYFFSSPPSMIVSYSPFAVQFVRERFLRFAVSKESHPRRFYVRRRGSLRNVVNEHEVISFFQKFGWGIVDAGEFPLEEQIGLFKNAEAIVAIHGSALANLLWAEPGCKVLELAPINYLTGVYEWISDVNGLDYRYIICPADPLLSAIVDLEKVRTVLDSWGL